MSTNEQNESVQQQKKLTQAEKAKQLLAQKKQQQAGSGLPGQKHFSTGTHELKSQNTKKVNNQRKKMGV
ncbi:hypothetical protein [Paenibacillus arenilitoris]|uniref:Uncharacterized protein n=1 Tax=Paenibacillus arenilitoris TaxID=2772299 RepID=A0A927CVK9_9BACL|nr:hypothetical protein [Paenibacillus arenilitoris]MBD2872350.1 hypothetical protein [Paenibacillus arenilitoris]